MNNILENLNWASVVAKILVILVCLPVHECAHAWTASKLRDSTGKNDGRITLNPIKHLTLWGTLMICLFGVGYAKPVSVNTYNLRKPKRDLVIVSFAGPLSNLVLAIVFLLLTAVAQSGFGAAMEFICGCLMYTAYINIGLTLFNLIPIPPLDGSKIAALLLPDSICRTVRRYEQYCVYVLVGALLLLSRIGVSPVSYVTNAVFRFLRNLIR